jgi:hypothetical protein
MGRLVILATREGSNPLRWVCSDWREFRSRRESLARQGYLLEPDDDTIIHQSDDRERAEDVAYNHLGRMVTYSARPDGVPRWISEQQF